MKSPNEKKPFLDGDLDADESLSPEEPRKPHYRWVAVHFMVFLSYSIIFLLFMKSKVTSCSNSYHSINDLEVKYKPSAYDDFLLSPYAGLPSPSIDHAWHEILEFANIRVTDEELRHNDLTSVKLPEGGGNMAWLNVFHELHCIKLVRQWMYRDYYHPNISEAAAEQQGIHADHCLDILRSAALCHADTTIMTFTWEEREKPMPDTTSVDHKCVDWESLVRSLQHRIIPKEEMARLQNPNLKTV